VSDAPEPKGRPIVQYLKNSWVILSTAIAIIIAGLLVVQVLGLDRSSTNRTRLPKPA